MNLAYLEAGLLNDGHLREDLDSEGSALWLLGEQVDAALVELCAEHLARWAAFLGEGCVNAAQLIRGLAHLELPPSMLRILEAATPTAADATHLAALAVHLVDVAEVMALRVFVAELPDLTARAERTGEAARSVGVARHLKG